MKPPQEGRNTGAPWLRGLQGRSATGLNVQAAKEEVSVLWGWMPENISGVPAGRSVFHLTSPLIGLSVKGQNALWRFIDNEPKGDRRQCHYQRLPEPVNGLILRLVLPQVVQVA